jgi:hypothetical protein
MPLRMKTQEGAAAQPRGKDITNCHEAREPL